MDNYSERKVTLSMLDAQVQLINALAEILAKGINYKGLPDENATECDICGRPCPDGELRCCEDHDLQAYGPVDEEGKYVDGDAEFEARREGELDESISDPEPRIDPYDIERDLDKGEL